MSFAHRAASEHGLRYADYLGAVAGSASGAALKQAIVDLLDPLPGQRVLDVGCGIGIDVELVAERLAGRGTVVGADIDPSMLATARRRAGGRDQLLVQAEAARLPFPAVFDACRIERTLQHVSSPRAVLAELVRTLRPGGVLVAAEPDWQTLVVDHPDEVLARRVHEVQEAALAHPHLGRQLRRLLVDAGLEDVRCHTVVMVFDVALYVGTAGREKFRRASMDDDFARFVSDLEAAERDGTFYASQQIMLARGRRPADAATS